MIEITAVCGKNGAEWIRDFSLYQLGGDLGIMIEQAERKIARQYEFMTGYSIYNHYNTDDEFDDVEDDPNEDAWLAELEAHQRRKREFVSEKMKDVIEPLIAECNKCLGEGRHCVWYDPEMMIYRVVSIRITDDE